MYICIGHGMGTDMFRVYYYKSTINTCKMNNTISSLPAVCKYLQRSYSLIIKKYIYERYQIVRFSLNNFIMYNTNLYNGLVVLRIRLQ